MLKGLSENINKNVEQEANNAVQERGKISIKIQSSFVLYTEKGGSRIEKINKYHIRKITQIPDLCQKPTPKIIKIVPYLENNSKPKHISLCK